MSNLQKQALNLILTIFSTFLVLLLANKFNVENFWLNPVIIFTILTLRSKSNIQKLIGISSFLLFTFALFLGFSYIGFLSGVINLALISGIIYVYEKENKTPGRWGSIFIGLFMLILSMIPYTILDIIWRDTFLEWGGKTAIIYGLAIFCETIATNREEHFKKWQSPKQIQDIPETNTEVSPMVKFLGVWLIVLNLSIFSYVFNPNETGFNLAALFSLLTLITSTFVVPSKNKEDVLNLIYTWIRPFQATTFLLLLIVHEKAITLGIFYITLLMLVHGLWIMKQLTTKMSLIISSLIVFFPLFGFLSNPFRLITNEQPNITSVLLAKNTNSLQSFSLSDLIKEDEHLNMKDKDFYKRLNEQSKESSTSSTSSSFEEIDTTKKNTVTKEAIELPKMTRIEKMRVFMERFNKLSYSSLVKNDKSNDEKYIFYYVSLTNNKGEEDKYSDDPILTFEAHVKEVDDERAKSINPTNVFNSVTSKPKKEGYQPLLTQLLRDKAIKEDDLEDGGYTIRYRIYDELGIIYKEEVLKTTITKGFISVSE